MCASLQFLYFDRKRPKRSVVFFQKTFLFFFIKNVFHGSDTYVLSPIDIE